MAKIVNNAKGFKVIKVSIVECVENFGGYGICDSCNDCVDPGYYVAALNYTMCEKCYRRFEREAKYYPEDRDVEASNFLWARGRLGLL